MKNISSLNAIFRDFTQHFPLDLRLGITPSHVLHEIVFLASLIHDGEVDLRKIKHEKGVLTIPFSRDRWEVFDENSDELLSVPSVLIFHHVESYDIRIQYHAQNATQFFDTVYVDQSLNAPNSELSRIVINNRHTGFEIKINVSDIEIQLQDQIDS